MKRVLSLILGATAVTVIGNQGLNFLNQPSTLAVTVGLVMLACCGGVVFVVGNYVVNSFTHKDKNDEQTNAVGRGTTND